jgi:hypothetical protein
VVRQNWKDLIEVVGIFSVVVTMAFVALEINQNTNAIRSSTIQDLSRWSYDSTVLLLENPELATARYSSCTSDLDDRQKYLLRIWFGALLRIQLNRFYQIELGILDEKTAMATGGRGNAYRLPYFSEAWAVLKMEFDEDFQRYVEENVLPLVQEDC